MEDAVRISLIGISYGLVLFLIASGLSVVLGLMGVLNLTHGSLYMLGAYIGIHFGRQLGNFWLVAVIAGLAAGVFGLLLERIFLRRLYGQFNEQSLLTLGFVYILANLVLWIWEPYVYSGMLPPFLSGSVTLGRLTFPVYRFALIAIGLVIAAALWWFQEKTRAGAMVRAGMDNKQMAMGVGINYGLLCSEMFFLGAFVAGFAGFIGSPFMGAQSEMGFPILLLAMIVVVIGGVGKVEGTLVGALIVGFIDSIGKIFFPDLALFTIYLLFIVTIMVRPSGILGRKQD